MYIPYDFSAPLSYKTFNTIDTEINAFNNRVTVIGKDVANTRNIYTVELGNSSKPTIFIEASIHGNEWHSTIFLMRFMEQLRDNTFPDKSFRNHLLARYHIVFVPIVNPYGYDNDARENQNSVDLNRDFFDFTQLESQAIRDSFISHKPFAFLDCHLMVQSFNANELIFGVGDHGNQFINDNIARDLQQYVGDVCTRWASSDTPTTSGLARMFAYRQSNPHTKTTISFISEITRDGYYTNTKMMKIGMAEIYLFLKYVTNYFETRTQGGLS